MKAFTVDHRGVVRGLFFTDDPYPHVPVGEEGRGRTLVRFPVARGFSERMMQTWLDQDVAHNALTYAERTEQHQREADWKTAENAVIVKLFNELHAPDVLRSYAVYD